MLLVAAAAATGIVIAVCCSCAAAAAAAAVCAVVLSLGREELVNGETDVIKQRAGALLCCRGTFLCGDTEVNRVNQQLRIPLQTHDKEQSISNPNLSHVVIHDQIAAKEAADIGR